jgi:catechol 2,3-dioxygenase-like lactoylglutathione lyase family enzyme
MHAFSHATVGVADLDAALSLWVDTFGFDVAARRDGPDPALSRLWSLAPDAISRQALVFTPGQRRGGLHFVEFAAPEAPVREGAEVFDRLPKNLDVWVRDLPGRYQKLLAAGREFRSRWVQVEAPDGTVFREVHMPSHDRTNVVFVEVLGREYPFSRKGYAGIGALITIVPDAELEKAFYERVLGLEAISHNFLQGPEVERMVGLPPGSALNIWIVGDHGLPLGEIEIVEYRGVEGEDRYPRARPPALGTLHVTYRTDDVAALAQRLADDGVEVSDHGQVDAVYGSGRMISFRSPSGFLIEAHESYGQEPGQG